MKRALALVAAIGCRAASADDPSFELRVVEPAAIEPGATAAVSVAIVPALGYTVSRAAPVRLELGTDEHGGLVAPRRRYQRRDAADPAADAPRFDVRVRATAPGDHPLAITARFWLCAVKTCRPIVARRTLTVRVAAPPIDAGIDAPVDAAPPIDAGRRRR